MAVQSNKRNQGIGRAIAAALEDEARKQGGLTIHLGADDEIGEGGTRIITDLRQLYQIGGGMINEHTR